MSSKQAITRSGPIKYLRGALRDGSGWQRYRRHGAQLGDALDGGGLASGSEADLPRGFAHQGLVLWTVWALVTATLPSTAEPEQSSLCTGANMPEPVADVEYIEAFKSFLASPLRVRYIRYLEDPSYFRVNGKPISYPVEFEAAIQEDTFYVKQLTNLWNPTSPPGPAQVEIVGASQTDFWRLEGLDLNLADKNPEVSGTNAAPRIHAEARRRGLESFLSLGIEGMDRDTLEWTGEWEFRANGWQNHSTILGRLVPPDDGRVKELVYVYQAPQVATTIRVRYAYLRTNLPPWMPSHIVREIPLKKGSVEYTTNQILECNLGVEDLPAAGYTPGRFLPPGTAWTNLTVMVFTNNVGWVHTGGQIYRTVRPSEAWRIHPSKHKWVRLGFFVIVATAALFCFWFYARNRQAHKPSGGIAGNLHHL
jgi:hypothetical protein